MPRIMWILVLLALVLRIGYVVATPDYVPEHDARDYDRLACALVTGDGYPRASLRSGEGDDCRRSPLPAHPTAFRPPGYPMFLAAVYSVARPFGIDRWDAGRVAQAVLGTAIVLLIGLIATRLWGRRTGLVALGLAAVYPPLILFGGALMTEPLLIALLLGAVLALLSRRLVIAALLTGLAVLTRSNAVLLLIPLACGAYAMYPAARWRHVAAFVAIALVTVAPWTIRNALAFHSFVPVSTEAGSAFIGTYNDAARTDPQFPGAWIPPRRAADLRGQIQPSDPNEPAEAKREVHAALRYIGAHPGYFATELGRNTVRLAGLGGRAWWRSTGATVSLGPKRSDLAAYSFFAILALGIVGILRRPRAPLWFWAIPVVLLLSVIPFVGETRFRIPIDSFFLLLAAVAISRMPLPDWSTAVQRGRSRAAHASPRSP